MTYYCKECNKLLVKRKKWQLFCSTHCRITHWMKAHPRINLDAIEKIINKKDK